MGRVAATAVFLFFRMGFLLCDHGLDFNKKIKKIIAMIMIFKYSCSINIILKS